MLRAASLIAIVFLNMGCSPQTKAGTAKPQSVQDSQDSVSNSTSSASTTAVKAKSKAGKTGESAQVEETNVSFETTDSKASPAAKNTKQKIRTQTQTLETKSTDSRGTCESLCAKNSVCVGSDRQSFCRWDKIRPNCFGLYWKDATRKSVCYHPFETDCSEEHPVECGVLKPAQSGKVVETVDFLSANTCGALCKLATGCNQSVCTGQQVCSGLFWNDKLLQNRNTVIHESQLSQSLPDHQRVPCGVYNYVA